MVVDKFCVFDNTVRLVASSSSTLSAIAVVFAVMAVVLAAVAVVLEAMALAFAVMAVVLAAVAVVLEAMALAFAVMALVFEVVVVSSASTLNKDALSAVCKLVITWFWTKITCLNSSIALRIEKRLLLFEK
jgi:hypothetical protein